ncbi:hypothetical protein SLS62_007845 [Diatrype stigma]|uniref:Uncharacterized protein n=1 Tax=Diatrype stigma TaxID=117547 RepID=A0AAN9YQC9_9PEZI
MGGGLAASRWATTPMPSHSRSRVSPSSIFPSSRLDDPLPPPTTSRGAGATTGGRSSGSRGSGSGDGSGAGTGESRRPPPSPQQELSRFLKIVSRIRWKLPFLDYGYKLATDGHGHGGGRPPHEVEASEIHFKIDFYEIYMHLERAIVHLLGVYGVDVHPSANGGDAARREQQQQRIGGVGQHQYHVNVLLALDDPRNPLHAVLGQGEARRQLWSAKDLRNRWKTADSDSDERTRRGAGAVAPLEAYNLELMLQVILAALEEAYLVTLRYVEEEEARANTVPRSRDGSGSEEQDWGFIADAMDWEAV